MLKKSALNFSISVFGFRLTIQNTANRHVSNAFDLIAVFISFPWRAAAAAAADFCSCCCAPPPHPAPSILGEDIGKPGAHAQPPKKQAQVARLSGIPILFHIRY
jgi:hypothetical protein